MGTKVGSNRGRRAILIFVIGVVLAVALVATAIYLSKNQTQVPSGTVLVAVTNIGQGSQVTAVELTTQTRPDTQIPTGALSSPVEAIGKFATVELPNGTVMLPSFLSESVSSAPQFCPDCLQIPTGDVAISIPYNPADAAGGYLVAGETIDILTDTTGTGDLVYSFVDVPVLKVGSVSGGANLIVVALPRGEAQALQALVDAQTVNPKGPHIVGFDIRPGIGSTSSTNNSDTPYSGPGPSQNPLSESQLPGILNS